MSVHLVYGLFLLQFVLGASLFYLDYRVRLMVRGGCVALRGSERMAWKYD